jgi:hypothetical protein
LPIENKQLQWVNIRSLGPIGDATARAKTGYGLGPAGKRIFGHETQPVHRMTELPPSADPHAALRRRHFTFVHVAAVAAAIAAYLVIFSITGDSDLFYAIGSGVGFWAVAWLSTSFYWRQRLSK